MSPRSLFLFLAGGLLTFSAVSLPLFAQNFAGGTNGVNGASTTPVGALTPWHEAHPDKRIFLEVRDGSLTVDGLTAKVQLNYEVKDQGYLYFFMPGEGTAIVSLVAMSDSERVEHAIRGSRMEFNVGGHDFKLDSAVPLIPNSTKNFKGGKDAKIDIYVRFDRDANHLARTPMFGYGETTQAPYNWPYSLPQQLADLPARHNYDQPPLPVSVLPRVQQVSLVATSR